MLKTFAIVAAVSSVVLAQSNSSLVPSGISAGCTTFLNKINDDASLSTCTKALTGALSAFAPGSSSASADAVSSALGNLCSASIASSCPKTLLTATLSEFSDACSDELKANPNKDVVGLYDILYSVTPMRDAVCAKDGDNLCALSTKPLAGASADSLQNALYTESNNVVTPNLATYKDNYIPFLFKSPDLSAEELCTPCTRQIILAYVTFGSDVPSAIGLQQSQLLSKQTDLFQAINDKCGVTFLESEVKAAGGIKSGPNVLGSGAAPVAGHQNLMAAVAGLMTLAVTVL
jgi:hypothetical protein